MRFGLRCCSHTFHRRTQRRRCRWLLHSTRRQHPRAAHVSDATATAARGTHGADARQCQHRDRQEGAHGCDAVAAVSYIGGRVVLDAVRRLCPRRAVTHAPPGLHCICDVAWHTWGPAYLRSDAPPSLDVAPAFLALHRESCSICIPILRNHLSSLRLSPSPPNSTPIPVSHLWQR